MDVKQSAILRGRIATFLEKAGYAVILGVLAVVPLYMQAAFIDYHNTPKVYLVAVAVLCLIIFFVIRFALEKKITWRYTQLDTWVIALAVVSLIPAVMSSVYDVSWFGRSDVFTANVFALWVLCLFFLFAHQFVNTHERWRVSVTIFLVSAGLSVLIGIAQIGAGLPILSHFQNATNTIDASRTLFGYWVSFVCVFAYVWCTHSSAGKIDKAAAYSVLVLSLLGLAVVATPAAWWLTACALVAVTVPEIVFKKFVFWWRKQYVLAAVMLCVVIGLIGGFGVFFKNGTHEISLDRWSSVRIAALATTHSIKNIFFGNGPGTFVVDYAAFKNPEINNIQDIWSLRFTRPQGSLLAVFAEMGFIFAAVLLMVGIRVGIILARVYIELKTTRTPEPGDMPGSVQLNQIYENARFGVVWLVFSASAFFVFYTFIGWWVWWVLLGMTLQALTWSGAIETKIVTYVVELKKPWLQRGVQVGVFAGALVVMFIVAARAGDYYQAEKIYTRALRSGDALQAQALVTQALSHRLDSRYYSALAGSYVAQVHSTATSGAGALESAAKLIAQAVANAKQAVARSPRVVENWENLARTYIEASAFTPQASNWVIDSWQQAQLLEPSNPILAWRLGVAYETAGKLPDAEKSYINAVTLKNDYFEPYISLISLYQNEGRNDAALLLYEPLLPYINNVDVVYNYGRLLFNRNQKGDRQNAEQLWLQIAQQKPEYVNALYSLGVLYESRGDKNKALEYYKKVRELSPKSTIVAGKVQYLNGELINVTSTSSTIK